MPGLHEIEVETDDGDIEIEPECGCGDYTVRRTNDGIHATCGCSRDETSVRARTMYGVTCLFGLLTLLFGVASVLPSVPLYASGLSLVSGFIAAYNAYSIPE